jgi:hypothetical protein
MIHARALVPSVLLWSAVTAGAAELTGDYVAAEQTAVSLTLTESAGGKVTGSMREGGASVPLTGQRSSTGFTGLVGQSGQQLPVSAVTGGDGFVLTVGTAADSVQLTFRRAAARAATVAGRVVVNGVTLSDADLARIEQQYHVRIDAAEYWYDNVLGAWGLRGGPTLGFAASGLTLGGALRADASGGNTSVFVNGRALHPVDLLRLQQLTGPILPGRYFIRADGLAGYEGGPPQWNLLAMSQQAGGGSNTWQSRLGSGFSDGTTGAVFLPNGGIVSTGQQ